MIGQTIFLPFLLPLTHPPLFMMNMVLSQCYRYMKTIRLHNHQQEITELPPIYINIYILCFHLDLFFLL